jgi:hypothetical protein
MRSRATWRPAGRPQDSDHVVIQIDCKEKQPSQGKTLTWPTGLRVNHSVVFEFSGGGVERDRVCVWERATIQTVELSPVSELTINSTRAASSCNLATKTFSSIFVACFCALVYVKEVPSETRHASWQLKHLFLWMFAAAYLLCYVRTVRKLCH